MKHTDKTVLVIGNTPFRIKIAGKKLQQWDNPANCIAFDDLKDEGRFFILEYYRHTCNTFSGFYEADQVPANLLRVIIPAELLRSSKLTAEACKTWNKAAEENNWHFFIGNEHLAQRLTGILPHIDLAGNDFTVDVRLKEFRETARPHNRIELQNMEMSDEGTAYLCLFHTKNRTIYHPSPDIREMPAHVVFLRIPHELILDPIAVAREHGLPDTDLLTDYPIQEKLSAEVLPLSETNLLSLIEKNRNGKG